MQPATTDTSYILTNPYAVHTSISVVELQLLLLAAVVCFVVGLLLAEQTTLRRILRGTDQSVSSLFGRATETL